MSSTKTAALPVRHGSNATRDGPKGDTSTVVRHPEPQPLRIQEIRIAEYNTVLIKDDFGCLYRYRQNSNGILEMGSIYHHGWRKNEESPIYEVVLWVPVGPGTHPDILEVKVS